MLLLPPYLKHAIQEFNYGQAFEVVNKSISNKQRIITIQPIYDYVKKAFSVVATLEFLKSAVKCKNHSESEQNGDKIILYI